MKQFVFTFIVTFLFTQTVFSQQEEDVVYLKDGSVLRGTIIDREAENYLRIQISGGSIFHVEYHEIERVTVEPVFSHNQKLNDTFAPPDGLFFHQAQVGILIGSSIISGGDGIGGLTLSYTPHLSLHRLLNIGIGVRYNRYSYSEYYMPVYAGISGDIFNHRTTLYYGIYAGYSIPFIYYEYDKVEGGLFMNFVIGLKVFIDENAAMIFNTEYSSTSVYTMREFTHSIQEWDYTLNKIGFNVGVVFFH